MTETTNRLEARADEARMAERVRLWDAINAYVVSCGGDPDRHVYGNTRRQTAVAQVEQIVREIRVSVRNEALEEAGKMARNAAKYIRALKAPR